MLPPGRRSFNFFKESRIVGTSASSGESLSDRYVEELPAATYWEEVQKFARFPQGIPPDLDLSELKPKSIPEI